MFDPWYTGLGMVIDTFAESVRHRILRIGSRTCYTDLHDDGGQSKAVEFIKMNLYCSVIGRVAIWPAAGDLTVNKYGIGTDIGSNINQKLLLDCLCRQQPCVH